MTPFNPEDIIHPLRQAFPTALAIYAFGSRVQGTARPDSDLDLAILIESYTPPLQLWDQANLLANQLNDPVDLLDFRAASTVMQHQILTTGQRLWSVEPQASLYECFVMSEKTHLDEARAKLLTDIAQQGAVYGR